MRKVRAVKNPAKVKAKYSLPFSRRKKLPTAERVKINMWKASISAKKP